MLKRSLTVNHLLCYLLVFIVLFQPVLFSFNILHPLAVISVLYILWGRKHIVCVLKKEYLYYAAGNLCYLVYTFIAPWVTGVPIYSAFLFAIELQVCVVFIYCLCKKNGIDVSKALLYAGVSQVAITICAMVFPSVQNAIINLYIRNGFPNETAWFAGKRFFGLSAQLTFTMPVVQTILAVLVLDRVESKNDTIKALVFSLFLVLSAIVNARNTLIVLMLGCIYILIRKWRILKKIRLHSLLLPLISVVCAIFISCLFFPETFNWIFTGFKDIFSIFTGNYDENSYFGILFSEFIFFPEDARDFIFGTGLNVFAGVDAVGNSDVGYIIDLWYVGVIGCILKYAGVCTALCIISKQKNICAFAADSYLCNEHQRHCSGE